MGNQSPKINPSSFFLSWNCPGDIVVGTKLGKDQLNAICFFADNLSQPIKGIFVYDPPEGTVLTTGHHTLSVSFSPTTTLEIPKLFPLKSSVTINVTKKRPTILWQTAEYFVIGFPITREQLKARCKESVSGEFHYEPTIGHIFSVTGPNVITVRFIPATDSDFEETIREFEIVVQPLSLIWKDPPQIQYGTRLSESQLNAKCNAAAATGVMLYTPSAGELLPVGEHVLTATYHPRRQSGEGLSTTGASTAIVKTVILEVTKVQPVLHWALPPKISVGEVLSEKHLCASIPADYEGFLIYNPPSGHVFKRMGLHTLSVTFVPSKALKDEVAEVRKSLDVIVQDLCVLWDPPLSVEYGTRLSTLQLNAHCSVKGKGTMTYDPPIGTLLPAGKHKLTATFERVFKASTETPRLVHQPLVASVFIEVLKSSPVLAWKTLSPIFVNEELSERGHLTAMCLGDAVGEFQYSPGPGHIFREPGQYDISVTFTPTPPWNQNYTVSVKSISVEVLGCDIEWEDPPPMLPSEILTSKQLNARPPPNRTGALKYNYDIGTHLPPGEHILTAYFYPSHFMDTKSGVTLGGLKSAPGDSVTPIVKSVILLVKKKVPTIAWKPDQRLCVFEELTEGHLNATSPDVKGLFFYDPPLKQFFTSAERHELKVFFSPFRDFEDEYDSSSKTIPIDVEAIAIEWAQPAKITYGTVLSSDQLNAKVLNHTGTFTYEPDFGTLLPMGNHTLRVSFQRLESNSQSSTSEPVVMVSRQPATATVTLAIGKANPLITWEPSGALYTGQELSHNILNAKLPAAVEGNLYYKPDFGHAFKSPGPQTLTVTFVPHGEAILNFDHFNVSISVNVEDTSIQWMQPTPIVYGTPLSLAQLNAVCPVLQGQVVFMYEPGEHAVLPAGPHTLTVRMCLQCDHPFFSHQGGRGHPRVGGTDLICVDSKQVSLIVNRASPSVEWGSLDSPIYVGESLSLYCSPARLQAAAVGGVFIYDPPLDQTIHQPGLLTASATFIPDEAHHSNFKQVRATIYVNVREAMILWPPPRPINYGEALGVTQLNAYFDGHTGTYTYDPGMGAVLPAGQHVLEVVFTPDAHSAGSKMAPKKRTVTITVNKVTPIIECHVNHVVHVGDTFTSSLLDVGNREQIEGTYFYDPPLGYSFKKSGYVPIKIHFVPSGPNQLNYNESKTGLQISVMDCLILWEDPHPVTYGTVLSHVQLNAKCPERRGIFVYEPALGAFLEAGQHTLSATFVAAEQRGEQSIIRGKTMKEVQLEVLKANPMLRWFPVARIYLGEPLSSDHLAAQVQDPIEGTYIYEPTVGHVFHSVGRFELTVTFLPGPRFSGNYNTVRASVHIDVVESAFVWPEPEPIEYGEALSDQQLNAQFEGRAGVYEFSPGPGTILPAGQHTLVVTFHPFPVSGFQSPPYKKQVQISVKKATLHVQSHQRHLVHVGDIFTGDLLEVTCKENIDGSFFYDPPFGFSFNEAGGTAVKIHFVPSKLFQQNYNDCQVTVLVDVLDSGLEWENPSAIVYGTILTEEQLCAKCSHSDGLLKYDPVYGTKLEAGHHTLKVVLRPREQQGERNILPGKNMKEVHIEVLKAHPRLEWISVPRLFSGEPLSNLHLAAKVLDPIDGMYLYEPAMGHVFHPTGVFELSVTFLPSSRFVRNYNSVRVSVSLEVIESAFEWPEPEPIEYGEALSEVQLNANFEGRAGRFEYVPGLGTVLPAGQHMLSVVFIPLEAHAVHVSVKPQLKKTVKLIVNKIKPELEWDPYQPLYIHESISLRHLNAYCSYEIGGTFQYSPSLGSNFTQSGWQELSVHFEPEPEFQDKFSSSDKTVTVLVRDLRLEWRQCEAIEYGTSLTSANALNAYCADREGLYSYDPCNGTVLSAGTHVITCKFYPFCETEAIVTGSGRVVTKRPRISTLANAIVEGLIFATPIVRTMTVVVTKATPRLQWELSFALHTEEPLTTQHLCCQCEDIEGRFIYEPALGHRFPQEGTHTISVSFIPLECYASDFHEAQMTVEVEVDYLSLEWRQPDPIPFGMHLGPKQLSAFCSQREGLYKYEPKRNTILPAGRHSLQVQFFPYARRTQGSFLSTDEGLGSGVNLGQLDVESLARQSIDTLAKPITKSVQIDVVRSRVTLLWSERLVLRVGEELTKLHLNASLADDVPGHIFYEPGLHSSFKEPGTFEIWATFVPQSTDNYDVARVVAVAEVFFLEWETPDEIIYGDKLTRRQLNAKCDNLTGDYSYEPPMGAELEAGTHSLSVFFYPKALYDGAAVSWTLPPYRATVELLVQKKIPTLVWNLDKSFYRGERLTVQHLCAECEDSIDGDFIYDPVLGTALLSPGPQSLTVKFVPRAPYDTNYSSVYKIVIAQVDRLALQWEPPAPIVFGQELTALQLCAECFERGGSYRYEPAHGAVLSAGVHTLSVSFSPYDDDTGVLEAAHPVTASVTLLVRKAVPQLEWSMQETLFIGDRLYPYHLNAALLTPIRGDFVFEPAVGYQFQRHGMHMLTARFVPTSKYSSNYDEAYIEREVEVQDKPKLMWDPPESLTFGEKLSEIQLNAYCISDRRGVIKFSPERGTILHAGDHTLRATFVPDRGAHIHVQLTEAEEKEQDDMWVSTISVPLHVRRAVPKLIWEHVATLAVGEPLTSAHLKAECMSDVEGVMHYEPTTGHCFTVSDSHSLSVVYIPTPEFSNNFTDARLSITIAVNPVALTWPQPSAIIYGEYLTEHQLNARCLDREGHFEYQPALGSLLNAGEHELRVYFTAIARISTAGKVVPLEDAHPTLQTTKLTVYKAVPELKWESVPALFMGQPLSRTHLSATCRQNLAGEFHYDPPLGHSFSTPGTKKIRAVFVPSRAHATNYTEAEMSICVEVHSATLVWPAPAPIVYGTPLSETQLSARCHQRDGAYEYIPTLGTVLPAGTHELQVVFTPAASLAEETKAAEASEKLWSLRKSVSLSVQKATPVLEWNHAVDLQVGHPLTESHLNATCLDNIEGTFEYDPGVGHCFDTQGTHTLTVLFIPSKVNAANYNEVRKCVDIETANVVVAWNRPSPIVYGEILSDKQLNACCAQREGAYIYTPPLGTLLDAGEHTLQVKFYPRIRSSSGKSYRNALKTDDSHDGAVIIRTTQLTVHKVMPSIHWDKTKIPEMLVGDMLTDDHLMAECEHQSNGRLQYEPAHGHRFTETGEHTLTVTFVPNTISAKNYDEASLTITLAVEQLTVAWPQPEAIAFGSPLTNLQLNARCVERDGTFEYRPPLGTILGAGENILQLEFHPQRRVRASQQNRVPIIIQRKLVVNKAVPVITWDQPPSILLEDTLSEAQLNARYPAHLDGKLHYDPPLGHRFSQGGRKSLCVVFTPSPKFAVNYTEACLSVSVEIIHIQVLWNPPQAIDYGEPLTTTQLNAVCTTKDGIFKYEPDMGTILNAGLHMLKVTFYPIDAHISTSANTVSAAAAAAGGGASVGGASGRSEPKARSGGDGIGSLLEQDHPVELLLALRKRGPHARFTKIHPIVQKVSLIVNKVSPPLAWQPESTAYVGRPLSFHQLNARCLSGIDGNYYYDPPLGHCFSEAGTQSLSVAFVPAQSFQRNYSDSRKSIQVQVAIGGISESDFGGAHSALLPTAPMNSRATSPFIRQAPKPVQPQAPAKAASSSGKKASAAASSRRGKP